MGQSGSVAVTVAMICLGVAAAASYALSGRVSRSIAVPLIVGSLIHLVNAAGFFILTSSNGHVSPVVLLPFRLLAALVPTILVTGSWNTMLALYVVLPAFSFLLAMVAIPHRVAPNQRSADA